MTAPWAGEVRRANGVVELVCSHGVGHPTRGSVAVDEINGIHGCDGCCGTPDWVAAEAERAVALDTP